MNLRLLAAQLQLDDVRAIRVAGGLQPWADTEVRLRPGDGAPKFVGSRRYESLTSSPRVNVGEGWVRLHRPKAYARALAIRLKGE